MVGGEPLALSPNSVVNRALDAHSAELRRFADKQAAEYRKEKEDSFRYAREFFGDGVDDLVQIHEAKGHGVSILLETGQRVRVYHNGRHDQHIKKEVRLERRRTFWQRIGTRTLDGWLACPYLRPKSYEVEVRSLAHLGELIEDEVREPVWT